ncbi:MAG: EAL domain-containing response regulator [Thermoanaerobaculia bacterium]|nr:EAL domain-containing response regulator [Thermoanaerobaculia bacterium]
MIVNGPEALSHPPPPSISLPGRPRILLVDDEPQALRLFSAFLSASGMEVVAVESAHGALELLGRHRFETVVTDLRMPGLDGFSLLRAVRERDVDLPVVVVTGCPGPETPADALELGAVDFLVKPVAGELLVRTVTTSIRLCRLARFTRSTSSPRAREPRPESLPSLAPAFSRALGSLYLAWQPIVRASNGVAWGHEAFARTLEPSLAAPSALLHAAEYLDRVSEIGRRVRKTVAEELAGFGSDAVFVNVHPSELNDEELLDPAAALSGSARSVVLELTDHVPLEGVARLRDRIQALRALGYRIGVDDVGASSASLNRLALVEPDFVKLSPSAIRGLSGDVGRRRLAGSMVRSFHDLGIRVVATGVETVDEHAAAGEAGVDFLQGFLFGRPKPVRGQTGAPRSEWAPPPLLFAGARPVVAAARA